MMSEADSADLSPTLVQGARHGELGQEDRHRQEEVRQQQARQQEARQEEVRQEEARQEVRQQEAVRPGQGEGRPVQGDGVPAVSSQLNTSDDIGTGQDLEAREDIGTGEANTSTDAVKSDQDMREEELDESDDVPEIKSKLSFKEPEPEAEVTRKNYSRGHQAPPVRNGQQRREDRPVKAVEIKPVNIGDQKLRSKLKFDVVTAKVVEEQGKKHVAYTIMMKRAGGEVQPAVICRRYNDFCYLYERILCTFHPSILGEFQFPKKVLMGNFKAETITERTDAFHKFLNLIASSDKLLYSDYFHAFLCSDEQNEAVSYIKLGK